MIESLAQAIRSVAFFVPGAVGVQEGGFVVVAGLFGVPPDAALSISLTKRVRELALGPSRPGRVAMAGTAGSAGNPAHAMEMDSGSVL